MTREEWVRAECKLLEEVACTLRGGDPLTRDIAELYRIFKAVDRGEVSEDEMCQHNSLFFKIMGQVHRRLV